jgi:1-acyl-sn-glycerol-3-phosphate acyltransferase
MANLVYREIDISRWEPALAAGPVLAVSNHFGGLSDGVLLIDSAPRMPRVVARDVIWKVPVVGRLATAIGMIPVHKAEDGTRSSNDQMFASAYQALAEGELVLIFPEGVTQDVPYMAEVRTGAARIALGARASGVAGIRILPLGVHYEDKSGFRTRALVNPGESIDLDAWADARPGRAQGGADDREAVQELTAVIDGALRRAAPDFPDWDTVDALHQAAEVLLEDIDPVPVADMRYGDAELLAARLNREAEPRRGQLVATGAQYRAALREASSSDRSVAAAESGLPRSWRWLLDLLLLVILLPFALVGLLAAAVPLLLVTIVSKLRVSPAVRATAVPAVALLAFVGEWFAVAWRFATHWGWDVGLAMLLLFWFFVGALFLAAELAVLLLRRWRSRRRPAAAELSRLQELRAAVADLSWGAL